MTYWQGQLPHIIDNWVMLALVLLAIISVITIVFSLNLMHAVIAMSGLSLIMALIYLLLDAPDVAITEAAVGACVSTIITLVALTKINSKPYNKGRINWLVMALVTMITFVLISLVPFVGKYGSVTTPYYKHVASYYNKFSGSEIGIPEIVTSILASYRGYDTLGETSVILVAALSIVLLLRHDTGR